MPLLEKFYGGKPAVAMFATVARFAASSVTIHPEKCADAPCRVCNRYKQEAYRHSEFAPQILHEAGFDVIMKVSSRRVPHASALS